MATTSYTGYSLNVYYDNDPLDGEGMVGRITDNGTTITPVPNLIAYGRTTGGDPQVEGFVNGGTLGLAAALRTGSPQVATVFDATTGSALTSPTVTWANVANMYGIVRVGNFLYVLDYDDATITRLNTSTYAEVTDATWEFTEDSVVKGLVPSGYEVHGQAFLNIGGTLYGLFTIVKSDWSEYLNSVLIRFTVAGLTGALSVGSTNYNSGIGKNAFAMAVNGSYLYIACLGGPQVNGAPNTNSSLDRIAYGTNPLTGASVGTATNYGAVGYEIRDISFNGSTAYLTVGSLDSVWTMEGKLLQATLSSGTLGSFSTIDDFTNGAPGYLWAAQYIDNNRILYARGNAIWYYDASSTTTPVAAFALNNLQSGSTYTALNDISYVGAETTLRVQGYRSPTQLSQTPRGIAARALAKGRPELTPEELEELEKQIASD